MSHRRAALYLQIPAAYCRSFGGLRWAQQGEAIEFLDGPDAGRTFAFAAEVGQFLEGLLDPGGPCPAFGAALHLLYMLGLGDRAADHRHSAMFRQERLAGPFRELGSPLRNAGALCTWLCRDLPGVADPPELADVLQLLNGGSWVPQMVLAHPMLGAMDYAEQPATTASELHAHLDAGLASLSDEAIRHWLKFGRGPLADSDRIPVPLMPHGSIDPLVQVEERPRLAGMTRLIHRLEGALSLPPRRLEDDNLQTDGYWDLTTHGSPEQILPIQFALEEEEFLRRFAERELLYFHRERPSRTVSQELVLLLDQGVRTWGDIRLVLAGAAMALARQAARRKLDLKLASTGNDDGPVDPAALDSESLGELLEASDFTPNPARALARLLRSDSAGLRDVVLLTHPRSLTDAEVIEAASHLNARDATRVFAVSVDAAGQIELAELRQGRPVAISRCRVELADATAPAEPAPMRRRVAPRAVWRGDVEPIPFPFRCGLLGPVLERDAVVRRCLDFDEAGGRILVALRHGLLCTFRVDGTGSEVLPRPIVCGHVMKSVASVIGVAGGFVLVGGGHGKSVLAHYDIPSRTCRLHTISEILGGADQVSWSYYADLHSVAGRIGDEEQVCLAVDLSASGDAAWRTSRAMRAAERARTGVSPFLMPSGPLETHASEPWTTPPLSPVILDSDTGMLRFPLENRNLHWWLTPMADGRPALKGARITAIHRGGNVLAVQVAGSPTANVWLVSTRRAALIGSFSSGQHELDPAWFALSRDGSRLARKLFYDRIEIRDVPGDRPPILVTPRERPWIHFASLGRSCLLVREFDQTGPRRPLAEVLIRWDGERLAVNREDPVQVFYQLGGTVAESRSLHPGAVQPGCDPVRFVHIIEHGRLRILVDRYNHLAILGPGDRLIAMLYLSGEEFAAWMPDGSCLGSHRLIGGEPTRAAAERVAVALRAVERGEGGVR